MLQQYCGYLTCSLTCQTISNRFLEVSNWTAKSFANDCIIRMSAFIAHTQTHMWLCIYLCSCICTLQFRKLVTSLCLVTRTSLLLTFFDGYQSTNFTLSYRTSHQGIIDQIHRGVGIGL